MLPEEVIKERKRLESQKGEYGRNPGNPTKRRADYFGSREPLIRAERTGSLRLSFQGIHFHTAVTAKNMNTLYLFYVCCPRHDCSPKFLFNNALLP